MILLFVYLSYLKLKINVSLNSSTTKILKNLYTFRKAKTKGKAYVLPTQKISLKKSRYWVDRWEVKNSKVLETEVYPNKQTKILFEYSKITN